MLAPNAPEPLGTLTTDFRRGASICIVFRPSSFVLRARARARARRSSIDEIASQPTVSPERVTVIQAEQRHLDLRHDDVLRGCYLLPEALAFLTKDRALAAKLTNLQKVLLPEGLLATQTVNVDALAPFGGMGVSGNGARYGRTATLDEFTQWQWITVKDKATAYPF
jgi:hypothetical protein